ncbi:hypothetical protein [Paraburkholderia sejongensis]|nr:hypothetical protein [Paraburkholderia sp. MMS20-SJTR3]
MRRLLAIAALIAGGLAAELAQPFQCNLLQPGAVQPKRRNR